MVRLLEAVAVGIADLQDRRRIGDGGGGGGRRGRNRVGRWSE